MIQTILECLPEPYAHNLKEVPTTSSNIPQCIGYDPQLHRLKSEMQPIPTMSKPMGQIDSFNSYNLEQPHSQRLRPFPSVRPSWSTQDPFFYLRECLKACRCDHSIQASHRDDVASLANDQLRDNQPGDVPTILHPIINWLVIHL